MSLWCLLTLFYCSATAQDVLPNRRHEGGKVYTDPKDSAYMRVEKNLYEKALFELDILDTLRIEMDSINMNNQRLKRDIDGLTYHIDSLYDALDFASKLSDELRIEMMKNYEQYRLRQKQYGEISRDYQKFMRKSYPKVIYKTRTRYILQNDDAKLLFVPAAFLLIVGGALLLNSK